MVEATLPIERRSRPLSTLFLDFNSYFASIEQQENPALRGRPVAVAPVDAETTCCISSSYEARRFGIKCGTQIGEARRMCPDLTVVKGVHSVYEGYYNRIREVVKAVLPIDESQYVDEMSFRLLGTERTPAVAIELGLEIKRQIRERVGECMVCSMGIAPNAFLAKVATEMQKRDGLVVLQAEDLPGRLCELKLTDFPGISHRMRRRLNAHGIVTTEGMCAASRYELTRAFGSIVGERWWYLLRGVDLRSEPTTRGSFSHSHVLPPALRTEVGSRIVLIRLLYKAALRLRNAGYWAEGLAFGVSAFGKSWEAYVPLPPTQDSTTLAEALNDEWPNRDFEGPRQVWVALSRLRTNEGVTPSLFDERKGDVLEMSRAIDRMNARFGRLMVYPAAIHEARDTAEERIAFGKKELLNEGVKQKEPWRDTFAKLAANDGPPPPEARVEAEEEHWWGNEEVDSDWWTGTGSSREFPSWVS